MVLDAVQGELVTKGDLAIFQEKLDNRFSQILQDTRLQIKESEFRVVTRLGFMMVSCISIAVAVLTWLIKI